MSGWTLIDTHTTQGRVFQRSLHLTEQLFLWGSLFNGTTDCVHHAQLRLPNGSRDAELFSEANIVRAWLSTKRRFPLVGATVKGYRQALGIGADTNAEGDDKGDQKATPFFPDPYFVLREHDLSLLHPREIIFGQVANAGEARDQVTAILNGPPPLSPEVLAKLYVFHEAGSKVVQSNVLHVITVIAHCITDGMANRTLKRCFVDTLARGGEPDMESAQLPLEDRLAMAVPAMNREPAHLRAFSPARRRWRRAAAAVIMQSKMPRMMQGGHTLPCRITSSTPVTPARSDLVDILLTQVQSAAIVANCRQHKITFGNAFFVLGQVAMTRVLYRRYLQGDISEEEWEFRKKQPYLSMAPANMRPYLDETWFEKGGAGEFLMAMSVYVYQLPFMTLGGMDANHKDRVLVDGAPPFLDLLTFDRFLYRAGLAKRETAKFFRQPLLLEAIYAGVLPFVRQEQHMARQWIEHKESGHSSEHLDKDEVLAAVDIPTVCAHGGSSLGNIDPIFPLEYPLPPTHALSPFSLASHPFKAGYAVPPTPSSPVSSDADAHTTPTIVVDYARSRLHSRPGELYLGAATSRGQLSLYAFYDRNVYEEEVVKEWLNELKGALLCYLG